MSHYLLVAAIDFGTNYSGYAFSFREDFIKDPLKINANQAWNAGGKQIMSLKRETTHVIKNSWNAGGRQLMSLKLLHVFFLIPTKNSLRLDSRQKTDSLTQLIYRTTKLLIALEAASIYCQSMPIPKLPDADQELVVASVGTKYMVVDLGGDTADIEIEDGRLKEIYCASGGSCGGKSSTIDSLITLISDTLSKTNSDEITHFILVRFFSECQLVQRAVRDAFPHYTVIVPVDSDLAVMNGAVIFGHKTSIIAQRISKYTYGFGKKKPFDRTKHHHNHHETVKGYAKCTHLFDAFITRYEIISSGKTVITTAKCRPSEDGIFKLRIFQTEKENPTYTDEEGCSVLGLITFKRTDSKSS
ncbi:unnamed protein product [Mytilus edulis]|uniref:Uncharacterized protein n=1 Tax=Mytilus edulis TaxID=6550 RepID=A0A8S3SA72_MYTED|nr:unnamed protein product [Mytilus edulis]